MRTGYKVVDLASLTTFAWDRVYFFDGEEGGATINSAIGFEWDGPFVPNQYTRLLFVHQQQVVAYVDLNKADLRYGDSQRGAPFPIWVNSCSGAREGIARKQAKFAAFRHCVSGTFFYQLVQLDCLEDYEQMLREGCQELPAQQGAQHATDSIQTAEQRRD